MGKDTTQRHERTAHFAGRLNALLLFDLFLLVFIFDVVVYELFVLGLLALSGLNALEVTDSIVLLCVRGS
jgi:hypothetical protein